ncbi:hypothetical protein N7492_010204 [Penicillium capsulatum]|uniref:Uncharacterized protein n=1 Tax=Penicillium capsulatum TaxID=69766 RepID=A0A9W9HMZ9_9EURO|nr:hypothetical protein N7492_010204 [Penicillium capsulatum]KAJ6112712.1 hypothetical protein N7512_008036 [Penicillium capsulatum]
MAKKRANDESDVPTQGNSKAVRFNAHTLKKLQAAIDDDPEIDLTTRMPIDYSSRLPGMRSVVDGCPAKIFEILFVPLIHLKYFIRFLTRFQSYSKTCPKLRSLHLMDIPNGYVNFSEAVRSFGKPRLLVRKWYSSVRQI